MGACLRWNRRKRLPQPEKYHTHSLDRASPCRGLVTPTPGASSPLHAELAAMNVTQHLHMLTLLCYYILNFISVI